MRHLPESSRKWKRDFDFPFAGRQIQIVAAILVGIGDQLGASLPRGDSGAGIWPSRFSDR